MKQYLPLNMACLALVAASILSGCAPQPSIEMEQPLMITSIESEESDGKSQIVIEGTGPIQQYTSFQLTEPLRLIVDITNADLGKFQDTIAVNKGTILDITPSQQDNIARLEIGLVQAVDSKVSQEDNRIRIEFGKPTDMAQKEPVPVAEAAAVEAQLPKEEKTGKAEQAEAIPATEKRASIISSVKATANHAGVTVTITGNGQMKPSTFMIEGKRLVIDVPGTRSKVRPNIIPVRKGGLDKVRIGQHPAPDEKVRVVLDLVQPMDYTTKSEGNTVIISMVAAGMPSVGEKTRPQEQAASVEKAIATGEAAAKASEAPGEVSAALPVPVKKEQPSVRRELAPIVESGILSENKYTGRKISLDLQDADLVNVLRLFAEVANLNMIISPEVKGKVTVRMVNVPWDQAMDIILKMNGLGHAREDNILRIASLASLARESDEESKAKEAKKKAEDLITRIVAINYTTAKVIEGTLKKSLSTRGETVVDERTNTIIIKDIARNVDEVVTLIKLLDKPIPQVMIEARVVEATTNFAREIGVQWGGGYKADAAHGTATGLAFPNSIGITGSSSLGTTASGTGNYFVNLPAAVSQGSGGAIGFQFGSLNKALNLDIILSAMESTGEGKVISSPRVSALDNKEAKIEQGQSIPYQTSSASGGTNIQFIDAKLALIVTPHVTPDNKIFMKIKATKNAPDNSIVVNGSPSIRKNEAETEMLLADGETAVIGGILIIDRGFTVARVPFFSDLPLIGWLFKKKTTSENKRELIIFITPRVVRQETI